MNENTKIITNLAIAIMKKQKRERPVREKDQRTSQSSSSSPIIANGAELSPTELNCRDRRLEASLTVS